MGMSRVGASSRVQKGVDLVVRLAWRLVALVVLLLVLTFFEALLIELAREGDLGAIPTSAPTAVRFTVDYAGNLLRGDLGQMVPLARAIPGTPVAEELGRALPKSLGLLAAALALAVLIGLVLGIAAALRRASRVSGILLFFSALGTSTPSFFAAMLLIWLAVWLYRSTGDHVVPISGFGWDAHLILPGVVLAARPAATMTRLTCNALVEILDADFVRTAVSKGLERRTVIWRHVLRNAGVPLLTTIGVSVRFSLAALPIVEYIFNWPGIGLGLLTAIQTQDATAAVGMTLPLVLLFALVNLLLDMVYPRVDPRLRNANGAVR